MRPHKHGIAWWTERDGHLWLVRRPAKGLLGGMAALPGGEWTVEDLAIPEACATIRHVFTHFSLDLRIVPVIEPSDTGWWHPLDRLDEAGLPTLYRKAVAVMLESRLRHAA